MNCVGKTSGYFIFINCYFTKASSFFPTIICHAVTNDIRVDSRERDGEKNVKIRGIIILSLIIINSMGYLLETFV